MEYLLNNSSKAVTLHFSFEMFIASSLEFVVPVTKYIAFFSLPSSLTLTLKLIIGSRTVPTVFSKVLSLSIALGCLSSLFLPIKFILEVSYVISPSDAPLTTTLWNI